MLNFVLENCSSCKLFVTDPRVNGWPMMSSPLPTLGICLFYAYFSRVLGPKLMENRKPFNLRKTLIIYNFVQTVFSAWIFYEVIAHILFTFILLLIAIFLIYIVPDEWMVGQLQLQMSASRLLE